MVCEDYFGCDTGMMFTPSRADVWGLFFRSLDPRVPLGDFVCRGLFRG